MLTIRDKWKMVQQHMLDEGIDLPRFGADGDPGAETVDGLHRLLDLEAPTRNPSGLFTGQAKGVKRLVIHCAATREGQDLGPEAIRRMHRARGWPHIGYHFVQTLDGVIHKTLDETRRGIHVRGFNTGSIALCYIGGLDKNGKGKDTRTDAQKEFMANWARRGLEVYPDADLEGHRDLSPDLDGDGVVEPHEWLKECPCFDVKEWAKAEGII